MRLKDLDKTDEAGRYVNFYRWLLMELTKFVDEKFVHPDRNDPWQMEARSDDMIINVNPLNEVLGKIRITLFHPSGSDKDEGKSYKVEHEIRRILRLSGVGYVDEPSSHLTYRHKQKWWTHEFEVSAR